MPTANWRRVMICQGLIETQAVVGLLEAEGIACRVRDLSVSPYPVSLGPMSERYVEVPVPDGDRAMALLATAREDGILDKD